MGDDVKAKNYTYNLEVGGNGRKMIWQGVPRSIRDSHRMVRDSFDGLIIQRGMALFFSGGERKEPKLRVTDIILQLRTSTALIQHLIKMVMTWWSIVLLREKRLRW